MFRGLILGYRSVYQEWTLRERSRDVRERELVAWVFPCLLPEISVGWEFFLSLPDSDREEGKHSGWSTPAVR